MTAEAVGGAGKARGKVVMIVPHEAAKTLAYI